jgi:hypothetical protein
MHKLILVLENSVTRATLAGSPANQVELGKLLGRWLAAAALRAERTGVCQSFVVGIHIDGPDCDHETTGVDHGRAS